MATNALPSMSTLGFIVDPVNKFDFLLSHFFLSDYNQTYLYKGNVTSLPRIIEEKGNNIDAVILEITNALNKYLGRYFSLVNTVVTNVDPLKLEASNVTLSITITIDNDGSNLMFDRLLETSNGKMQKIVKINNYTK